MKNGQLTSAARPQLQLVDEGLLSGGLWRGEPSEIRTKFEKFWRAIVRLGEHNCEIDRDGIDETETGFLRLAHRVPAFRVFKARLPGSGGARDMDSAAIRLHSGLMRI